MPSSKLKEALARILEQEGYITGFEVSDDAARPGRQLTITLKYTPDRKRTISGVKRDLEARPARVLEGDRRAARARRNGHLHPVDQPGSHDRPRGAEAPRRRRDPLPGLVTADVANRQAAHHDPERRRGVDRRLPRHGEGPEGHARARRARDDHDQPRGRRRSSSRVPTTSAANRALHGLTRSLVANMVTGVSEGFTRELEIVGVGYRAAAAGPTRIDLQLGFSHPVHVDAPDGVEFEVPVPDPHHRQGLRQAARGPGRGRHPQDPQARALQGQGHPLLRRARAAQGRQVGEVEARRACRTDMWHGQRRHRRVRKKVRGTAAAPAPGGVPLEQAHLRAGDRRRERSHARVGVHGGEETSPARPPRSRRPRRSASSSASAPRGRASTPSCSTAAASATTVVSPGSPTAHAKPGSRSKRATETGNSWPKASSKSE